MNYPELNRLFTLIEGWANDRNLIKGATTQAQTLKLASEMGEVAEGFRLDDEAKIIDAIGDCMVVMVILAAQLGTSLYDLMQDAPQELNELPPSGIEYFGLLADAIIKSQPDVAKLNLALLADSTAQLTTYLDDRISIEFCIAAAYEQIKDRKGVLYNGVYIKSTDERYPSAYRELFGKDPE